MSTSRLVAFAFVVAGMGLGAACANSEQTADPPAISPVLSHETPVSSDKTSTMSHGQPPPAGAQKAPLVFDAEQPVGTTATCPVLGNPFTITADTLHSEYKGRHVYFCCAGCKPQFDADPEKYLKSAGAQVNP